MRLVAGALLHVTGVLMEARPSDGAAFSYHTTWNKLCSVECYLLYISRMHSTQQTHGSVFV